MAIVIDASIAIGWFTPTQAESITRAVLESLQNQPGMVPRHFALEVARSLRSLERRNLISPDFVDASLANLTALPLREDAVDTFHILPTMIAIARRHALRVADAGYLELAIRYAAPLATRDVALARAAVAAGAKLFTT
jgi:predicted nucleic acid-binding protein